MSLRRSLRTTSAARSMSERLVPWAIAATVPIEHGQITIPAVFADPDAGSAPRSVSSNTRTLVHSPPVACLSARSSVMPHSSVRSRQPWLLVSSHGWRLLTEECGITDDRALKQATGGEWTSVRVFDDTDRGAEPASGSAKTAGMVICPCSMGTVAAIAHGTSRSLIERAADVVLKERRRLILVPRETPLSLVHLRNLTLATEAGAVVLPAAPGFYHRPQLVRDLVDFVVQRVLDHLGLDINLVKRWEGK